MIVILVPRKQVHPPYYSNRTIKVVKNIFVVINNQLCAYYFVERWYARTKRPSWTPRHDCKYGITGSVVTNHSQEWLVNTSPVDFCLLYTRSKLSRSTSFKIQLLLFVHHSSY